MRSRFIFAGAFALVAVAPVMSLPASVHEAREIQSQYPSELGYLMPNPQPTTPFTGHYMNLVPVTHPEQPTASDMPHFMNLVPVTHPPPTGVMLKRSPDSDSFVGDVALNVKRDTQTGAGAAIEQRSLKSFLNSKPVQEFSNVVSVASIFTMEKPKGL